MTHQLRRFRIRRCECGGGWTWECTHCQPAARGSRHGEDSWWRVVTQSMPRHFAVRGIHHRWVARSAGDGTTR